MGCPKGMNYGGGSNFSGPSIASMDAAELESARNLRISTVKDALESIESGTLGEADALEMIHGVLVAAGIENGADIERVLKRAANYRYHGV